MSEGPRLDPSDEALVALDPALDALLEAERSRPEPEPAARARFAEAVLARAAGGAAGDAGDAGNAAPAPAPGAARTATPAPTALGAARWIVTALATGALAGSLATVAALRATTPSTPPRTAAPPPLAAPADAAPSAPPPAPEAPAPAPSTSPPRASASLGPAAATRGGPPSPDATESRERAWIERARAARVRGDHLATLAAADAHRRAFPRGELAEERELLAIQALARLGRRDEAAARAAAFRTAWPDSVHRGAVEGALR